MKLRGPLLGLLLPLLIALPVAANELNYAGPSDTDSFFAIGWSKNGRRFAYGWFAGTQMISAGSSISVVVQDLGTDKVLFQTTETWDEGNVGDGQEGWYPRTAREAWAKIAGALKLNDFGITTASPKPVVSHFPYDIETLYGRGEQIPLAADASRKLRLTVAVVKEGKDYRLYAISEEKGEKGITTLEGSSAFSIFPRGYVLNPAGTRIALLFAENDGGPYEHYIAFGSNLVTGFKKGVLTPEVLAEKRKVAECSDDGGNWTDGRCVHPLISAAGLQWDTKVVKLDWDSAVSYCRDKGMRLPTTGELNQAYESNVAELRRPGVSLWSSETSKTDDRWAKRVPSHFRVRGGSSSDRKTNKNHVRCVGSNP